MMLSMNRDPADARRPMTPKHMLIAIVGVVVVASMVYSTTQTERPAEAVYSGIATAVVAGMIFHFLHRPLFNRMLSIFSPPYIWLAVTGLLLTGWGVSSLIWPETFAARLDTVYSVNVWGVFVTLVGLALLQHSVGEAYSRLRRR